MSVHIQKGFKPAVMPVSGLAKIKQSHHLTAFLRRRKRKSLLQPEIPVPACKELIQAKIWPFYSLWKLMILLIPGKGSLHGYERCNALLFEIPALSQLLHTPLKFINR